MSDNDIFDELDGRTSEPNDDLADWWEPEPNETLVGIVVEMHSEPEAWTDAGEVPDDMYTVMSVGRGDVDAGVAVTPKQHKQLKNGLSGAGVGDLVKLEFTGYTKVDNQPQPMYTYEIGVLSREEWEMMEGADDIEALLEEYNGISGDNRRTTPYEEDADPSPSGSVDEQQGFDNSEEGQAAEALLELLSIQGGSVDRDTAERIITDVRDFDVDLDDVIMFAGLTEEDGELSQ